jgi:predicted RND superfamily exporter protein
VSHRFAWLADWIIDHRLLTTALLVCVTTLAAIGHYDPYLLISDRAAVEKSRARDEPSSPSAPQRQPPANVSPVRVESGDVIVMATCEEFFTPAAAEAIRAAVDALLDLPQVRSILWMEQAPQMNLFGLPEPVFPRRHASAARFAAARRRALEHPLIGGQLLSPDGKTLLLMVNIDWLYVTDDSQCTDLLRDTAASAAAAFPEAPMEFAVTGNVPIRVSNAATTRENERKYQLIGYSMALVIAFVLFRGLASVVIVAIAPALGVYWTLGFLHLIGWDDNPFNSVVVPVLLCMVGFTDGVHMMVQIRRHRAEGMAPAEAARQSIREVGLACWLTSFTTAIGFGSLALAHHEIVREFGYCCVIGVLTTFVAVVTIIPLACATPLGRGVHTGYGRNLIDSNLEKISGGIDFVLQHSRTFAWGAILSTACLALFTLQLRPDERLTSSLPSGSEAADALAHIDRAFGGMETANVQVQWNETVRDNSGEIARVVAKVDRALRGEPLIGHPLSLVSLLAALPGEGDPGTRMSLMELLPPPLKRAYFVPEYRNAKVTFRLQDIGIAQYGPVFERIEEELARIQTDHPAFRLWLDGGAVWRWKELYRIVVDLATSLGTASLIIFGVLTFVFRSLRIGLISLVPNLFPLAATGSVLLVFGQNLEIVSVCAFTVCLGIAVDDTIHFLTRYREQQELVRDRRQAIRQAFVGVGTALIMTTVVLVMGFSTALLSDARDHRVFATMGILTIGTALAADLFFLPALLLKFAPDAGAREQAEPRMKHE